MRLLQVIVLTRITTGVVALSDENEIYLVGQYRYPTRMYSWKTIEGAPHKGDR